jgi:hypothetical protein
LHFLSIRHAVPVVVCVCVVARAVPARVLPFVGIGRKRILFVWNPIVVKINSGPD